MYQSYRAARVSESLGNDVSLNRPDPGFARKASEDAWVYAEAARPEASGEVRTELWRNSRQATEQPRTITSPGSWPSQ